MNLPSLFMGVINFLCHSCLLSMPSLVALSTWFFIALIHFLFSVPFFHKKKPDPRLGLGLTSDIIST